LEALGSLDVLGSPKTDNQYHAAWAWAGSTPYKGMKLPVGRTQIEVDTAYAEPTPGGPLAVTLRAGDEEIGSGTVPISAPLLFTANDCLDIGRCLGSPVSLDYDKAPFAFKGTIERVYVRYT
jgi:arylsulfatase